MESTTNFAEEIDTDELSGVYDAPDRNAELSPYEYDEKIGVGAENERSPEHGGREPEEQKERDPVDEALRSTDPIERVVAEKGGRPEDWSVADTDRGEYTFDREREEMVNADGVSIHEIRDTIDPDLYAMLENAEQQWKESDDPMILLPDEIVEKDGEETLYVTYLILGPNGEIDYIILSTTIRSREEDGSSAADTSRASEPVAQFRMEEYAELSLERSIDTVAAYEHAVSASETEVSTEHSEILPPLAQVGLSSLSVAHEAALQQEPMAREDRTGEADPVRQMIVDLLSRDTLSAQENELAEGAPAKESDAETPLTSPAVPHEHTDTRAAMSEHRIFEDRPAAATAPERSSAATKTFDTGKTLASMPKAEKEHAVEASAPRIESLRTEHPPQESAPRAVFSRPEIHADVAKASAEHIAPPAEVRTTVPRVESSGLSMHQNEEESRAVRHEELRHSPNLPADRERTTEPSALRTIEFLRTTTSKPIPSTALPVRRSGRVVNSKDGIRMLAA